MQHAENNAEKIRGLSGYGCLRYRSIPNDLPQILDRLKIDRDNYVRFINRTQKSRFHGFIGTVKSMRSLAQDFGKSFLKGQAAAAALFSPG